MTYPPPEPGRQPDPPPADPFLSPPGFDQPYGGQPYGEPPGPVDPYQPGPPSGPPHYGPPPGQPPPYGQPPYGQPTSGQPTTPYGPSPYGSGEPPGSPASGPPGQFSAPPGPPGPPYGPGGPAGPYPQPPRRNRRGLLIAGAAVAAVLVLCGGGGVAAFMFLRDGDRDGAESPTAAVQAFLQAVYRDQDPERAAALVCSEGRDEDALASKIDEIRGYQDTYLEPRFTWSSPEVVDEGEELATVATTVTMITGDERVSDLALQVTVLDKGSAGWWVCDLATGAADPESPPGGESPQPTEPAESGE